MAMISMTNVTKQIAGKNILKNVSLSLDANSQIGIKMAPAESKILFQLISKRMQPSSGTITTNTNNILYELSNDGLYDNLTVKKYLTLFNKIGTTNKNISDYLQEFSIADIWNVKIKKLSIDQKKRVSLLRMFILSPELLLIESPLANLSDGGIELYLRAMKFVKDSGITILTTSHYIEELLLLGTDVYRYNAKVGLEKTDISEESDFEDDNSNTDKFQPQNVFKVACKLADKTIFFSPDEIDFIESINSVSNIRIGEDYYPSALTLNELEEKLAHFGFYRCHRSYLVNLQRISELISYSRNSYTLVLKGPAKEKLPLSRVKVEELRQLIEA
ncbi:LytTR family transcriptional regulator DNA-binding domain-containing protein [Companilactobacillus hulinensis]|uniref:LytTR family transcriptional regulator DNA-binding domain-containing protein n=1 Tax=Companilactobacillus hulinensis TaxID=2486007 RepID=UPI000F7A753B|nr:LytTR family transcriptional regulator DNA-binding domain-containing protein [Companilactobacillus hulinensis]